MIWRKIYKNHAIIINKHAQWRKIGCYDAKPIVKKGSESDIFIGDNKNSYYYRLLTISKITLVLIFLTFPISAGWHDRKAEGWAWYEDRCEPTQTPQNEKKEPIQENKESDPTEKLKEIAERLENLKSKAILYPTEENIVAYIREQNRWMNHSSDFAHNWMLAVLKHPELNFAHQGTPTSRYGQRFFREQKELEKKELIKTLSNKYALLFFYEGGKPESQEVSKVIDMFSKRYSWVVSAYSVDGIECDEFPDSIVNKKLKEKLGLSIFPALAVVCPENEEIIPIGFGFMSLDTIEKNIELVFTGNKNGDKTYE